MRLVLKRRPGVASSTEIKGIAAEWGAQIVDQIDDMAALIDLPASSFDQMKKALPDWTLAAESTVERPKPPFPKITW